MTIIFDLDGALLNTIDDLGYACNGINNLIRRALPESERTEENIQRVRTYFVPYYNAHNCDYTRPYDGIPELLAALKAQGHRLAVASNKYQAATEKIVGYFFPDMFDVEDRETAANAGVPFVACSWGFVPRQQLLEAGVTRIVDQPNEILQMI